MRASRRGHYCAAAVVVTYLLNDSALLDSWLLGAVWTDVVHNTQALALCPSLVRPSSASDSLVDPPGDPDRDTSSGVRLWIGFLQAHALVQYTTWQGSIVVFVARLHIIGNAKEKIVVSVHCPAPLSWSIYVKKMSGHQLEWPTIRRCPASPSIASLPS